VGTASADASQMHPRCTQVHPNERTRKQIRAEEEDPSTLKRWMRLPEFIAEYRRARWDVVEQAYARVHQNTPAAASVLLKLMVDPATPASGRIRAALGTFGLAREALDLDIETRVAALEQAAELSKQGR
jgi:hypothetical protein